MLDQQEELLDANKAVKYLAERWGMESYSLVAFRSLRMRRGIEPALKSETATFWRKSDLDAIPKPNKGHGRGGRTKRVQQQDAALLDKLAGITDSEQPAGSSEGTPSMLSTRYPRRYNGLSSWLTSNLDPNDDDIPDDEKPDIKHRPLLALAEV